MDLLDSSDTTSSDGLTPSPDHTSATMPTTGECAQLSRADQLPSQSASLPPDQNDLEPYAYRPFNQPQSEIRLMTIRPGSSDDPMEITLTHVSLNPLPPQTLPNLMTVEELRLTLPRGWLALLTIRGRIIFLNPHGISTWIHPNPQISQAAYDITLHPTPSNGDTPYFEALSYTWGSLRRSAAIVVIEGSRRSLLRVGENLAEALRFLRLPEKPRVMWVDALCINQEDFGERGQQVARMAQIYSRAFKVVAWLGPDCDDVAEAFENLTYIGNQIEYAANNVIMHSPGSSRPLLRDPAKQLPSDDVFWAPIIKLFDRPWFRRLWVIQEIHIGNMNSYLQSGVHEIPWLLFRHAVLYLGLEPRFPIPPLRMGRLHTLCDVGNGFIERIPTVGSRFCYSDSRDVIYGLLSLATPELLKAICVDYSSDVQSVYRGFFTAYASLQNRNDLLLLAGQRTAAAKATSQFWPSWLVDWRTRILRMRHLIHKVTSAAGQSCAEFNFGADSNNQLNIQGVFVDDTVLLTRTENFQDLAEVIKMLRNIAEKRGSATAVNGTYTSRAEIVDSYIDVLHEGLSRDRDGLRCVPSPERFRQDILENPNFSLESEASYPPWWKAYQVFLRHRWVHRDLSVTKKGVPAAFLCDIKLGKYFHICT